MEDLANSSVHTTNAKPCWQLGTRLLLLQSRRSGCFTASLKGYLQGLPPKAKSWLQASKDQPTSLYRVVSKTWMRTGPLYPGSSKAPLSFEVNYQFPIRVLFRPSEKSTTRAYEPMTESIETFTACPNAELLSVVGQRYSELCSEYDSGSDGAPQPQQPRGELHHP